MSERAARPWWLVIPALLVAFVALRWAQVSSSGHLYFHLDRGEYGLLLTVARFSRWDTTFLVTDPTFAPAFFADAIAIGDTGTHGTLATTTTVLHALVADGPLRYSTATLRGVALASATLALLLWSSLLALRWRAPAFAAAFVLCWTLGPAAWAKLNVLCWGSHEQIALLFAMFAFALAPGPAGAPRGAPVAVGLALALALYLNTLLLLPTAALALVVALQGPGGASVGSVLLRGAQSALVAILGARALLLWPPLAKLRADPVTRRFDRLQALVDGGIVRWPGPEAHHGLTEAFLPLAPALCVAGIVLARAGAPRPPEPLRRPLLWAATSLLLCSLGLVLAPPAYDERGAFVVRYALLLYPFAFVLIAGCLSGDIAAPRPLRALAVALSLLPGLRANAALVDLGNLGAARRWDGVLPFALANEEGNNLPLSRTPHGGAPLPFHRGVATQLSGVQSMDYFRWKTAGELRAVDLRRALEHSVSEAARQGEGPARTAFLEGVGFALSVQVPSARRGTLIPSIPGDPQEVAAIETGYALPDDAFAPSGDEPILQKVREAGTFGP